MNPQNSQFKYRSWVMILPFVMVIIVSLACGIPLEIQTIEPDFGEPEQEGGSQAEATVQVLPPVPTLTLRAPGSNQNDNGEEQDLPDTGFLPNEPNLLIDLYQRVLPGVVTIQVFMDSANGFGGGGGAGSGFIFSDGYIVTNNHVVSRADFVTVSFFNGVEAQAEVVGTDDDSDLAIVRVENLPEGVYALPLGDSDNVQVGEWVVAIGNPFELSGSMTVGIVSAVGREIESGFTSFSIPQAIQTDAAINPGNSGGPLLNLNGEVIGVNAQIATGGAVAANAGVGFAIPSNIVRRVAPSLVEFGEYTWPWLGVTGNSVNLAVQQANELPSQNGAYIHTVVTGGPAVQAGLRGSTGETVVNGVSVPVGGDVVIAANGQPINDFTDLLVLTSNSAPGDQLDLTIVRDGVEMILPVTLGPRPGNVQLPAGHP